MIRVEKLMGLMAVGLLKEIIIQCFDVRIFMRVAQFCLIVQEVKVLSSLVSHLKAVVDGLSAAAYTASRTSHDLYEIIFLLTSLDRLKKLSCIAQTIYNSDAQADPLQLKLCLCQIGLLGSSCLLYTSPSPRDTR